MTTIARGCPRRSWMLLVVGLAGTHQALAEDAAALSHWELDCVLAPSEVTDLGSSAPGVLDRIEVDRSDFVEAGQVVASLEDSVERAAVALARERASLTAEADLRRVKAGFDQRQYERTRDLFAKQAIATNDLDQRKTEAELARQQLRQAEDNRRLARLEFARAREVLARRSIRSPLTGVVMERFKAVGEYVEDQPVLRVARLDPLHVEVIVPVELLGQVHEKMQARVWTDVVEDVSWLATVTRVDRVADAASGTFGVRLTLQNPELAIPAGLRCRLNFLPEAQPGALTAGPVDEGPVSGLETGQDPGHSAAATADDASVAAGVGEHGAPGAVAMAPQGSRSDARAAEPLAPEGSPCSLAGPYTDVDAAEQQAASLREAGLEAAVHRRRAEVQTGYKVLSPPLASKAEAAAYVSGLRAAGIGHYYLYERIDGVSRIALGAFEGRRYAEARLAELKGAGFEARIEPWHREQEAYWLTVRGDDTGAALDDLRPPPGLAAAQGPACAELAGI